MIPVVNVLAPRPALRIRETNFINRRQSTCRLWCQCARAPESHSTRKNRLRIVPATPSSMTYPLFIDAKCLVDVAPSGEPRLCCRFDESTTCTLYEHEHDNEHGSELWCTFIESQIISAGSSSSSSSSSSLFGANILQGRVQPLTRQVVATLRCTQTHHKPWSTTCSRRGWSCTAQRPPASDRYALNTSSLISRRGARRPVKSSN